MRQPGWRGSGSRRGSKGASHGRSGSLVRKLDDRGSLFARKRRERGTEREKDFLTLHGSGLQALAKSKAVHFFAPAARLIDDGLHKI